jgi:hypothetical protein
MLCRLLMIAMLPLALSGTAYAAGVLITPPPENNDSVNGSLKCQVLNVSSETLSVTIQIFNFAGGQSLDEYTNPTLAPGRTDTRSTSDITARWCKITVNDGKKKDVKGTLCVFQSGTGCLASTVAE